MAHLTINGYALSFAERDTLDAVVDYLKSHGGDSGWQPGYGPAGDGYWISLLDVFPRSNSGTAARRCVERLHKAGVLRACMVAYYGNCVKAVPCDRVEETEREAARMNVIEGDK